MARIRDDDKEAVRHRTDIVRLVQQYVALKKAGADRFVGLCPFHTEKTPSFGVSPSKGMYYCHGCGKGGDVFTFIREIEGLEFTEAVERLAGQAGITLRYEGVSPGERRQTSRRQALHRASAMAADLYRQMLLEGREAEAARRYLEKRGISRESVEAFGIGFAPGYPDFLLRRMAREFSPEILVEAGLAAKDPRGGIRDRFRSRITFPIHDLSGNAVGFGARLLEGDGPKYLNSPETPVYRKGELLYNLHRAKGDVTKAGRAFVVEGYTDVIALAGAGIPVAVATCGTALGEGHFRLLSRFARGAVLCFDADEAGARAAERAYGLFEKFALDVSVLILPQGQDPADFVSEEGGESFERLAERAEALVDYMLQRSVRDETLDTPEGQSRAVRLALPIVVGLTDPVLQSQYAGRLADLVGVSPTDVRLELDRAGSPERPGSLAEPEDGRAGRAEVRTPAREVEKEALKVLAQLPDIGERHAEGISEEHFTTERYRKAWALLQEAPGDPAALADRAGDRGQGPLIAELTVEPLKGEPTSDYAERVFARLEELRLRREVDTMRRRLEALNPVKDPDTFDALFAQLADVTSRWRDARTRAGEGA
ncbi:MAG: DNA primase [Actinomycetota bacterium]